MVKINNITIKDYLSFKNVKINLKDDESNLVLFTGASGVGKSILMNAILSNFGIKPLEASVVDMSLNNQSLNIEDFEISKEEDIFLKGMKNVKAKYLLNDLNISKKKLSEITSLFVKHISLKNVDEFENENVLDFIDTLLSKKDKKYLTTINLYKNNYKELQRLRSELNILLKEQDKVEELKDFLSFEIDKINKIKPEEGEYEELQDIKKKLSQKDRIEKQLNEANSVISNFSNIYPLLETLEVEPTIVEECQNYLENIVMETQNNFNHLEDIDIENTLDRITEISNILKKYGSLENMYKTLEEKEKELEKYNNIELEIKQMKKKILTLNEELIDLASQISKKRNKIVPDIIKGVNTYLEQLFLKNFDLKLVETENIYNLGKEQVEISLNNTNLNKISSGEFNRLRLAFLSLKSDFDLAEGGILFLDEIDANLSGKESEGIANLVKKISYVFQVFSISHQPQLTSMASQHFLIEKNNDVSTVRELNSNEERINEIARMISGKNITEEAILFASKLIKN